MARERKHHNGRVSAEDAPAVVRRDGTTWLQVIEAARRLNVSRGRIYHLIWEGRLRTKEHHRLTYVRDEDVRVYKIYQRELAQVDASYRGNAR